MRLYLGHTLDGYYEFGGNKGKFSKENGWAVGHGYLISVCEDTLQEATGLNADAVKPGECRRVKVSLEVI